MTHTEVILYVLHPRRGYGLRCLDDIPCGTFITTYSGQLLTEADANEVTGFLLVHLAVLRLVSACQGVCVILTVTVRLVCDPGTSRSVWCVILARHG